MKGSLFTGIATLVVTTLASPALVVRQTPVTAALFDNFKLFTQYSAAAFCNNENAVGQKVSCGGNFCPLVEANNVTISSTFIGAVTDIRGFVALDHTARVIVVSFRGTVSWRNWIADAIFTQVPCDLAFGCLVHTGFFASWKEISSRVLQGVKAVAAANPTWPIVVTGHSLGGAVATLATPYIRKANLKADLYTSGSPRVGNSVFVKYVTNQAGGEYRLTHEADPFARLPPIIFNYRHTSPEYWLKEPALSSADIKVCTGYADIGCNAGTTGFDLSQHSDYFEPVNGCEALGYTPWRRQEKRAGLTDAELRAKLAEWAKADVAYANDLVE